VTPQNGPRIEAPPPVPPKRFEVSRRKMTKLPTILNINPWRGGLSRRLGWLLGGRRQLGAGHVAEIQVSCFN
jgi:hypothetical protein